MKHNYLKSLLLAAAFVPAVLSAQTVSTLESLPFGSNEYYDEESTTPFSDGNVTYRYIWDDIYGYWQSGFIYSRVNDSTTSGPGNLAATKALTGYNGSSVYAVGTGGSVAVLTGSATGGVVEGFYVTNSTYAYNSMRDGDSFAKKFGGDDGNDPDWFALTVRSYLGGVLSTDSVAFYLADFRFSDNTQDYIVSDWTWLDLSSLGNADSLVFELSSSDVGGFGMNTPSYFCLDNLTTRDTPVNVAEHSNRTEFSLYPNPASDFILVNATFAETLQHVEIYDVTGKLKMTTPLFSGQRTIDIATLESGVYLVAVVSGSQRTVKRFMKH